MGSRLVSSGSKLSLGVVLLFGASMGCRSHDGAPPAGVAPASVSAAQKAAIVARAAKLPFRFEANAGQIDERARFLARSAGMSLFLTDDGAVLSLQRRGEEPTVLDLKVHDGRRATLVPGAKLQTLSNYFLGNDPAKWRTGVPNYASVTYRSVKPGVDLVYHGSESGRLEYDFVVAPGTSPEDLSLDVEGASNVRVEADGALAIDVPGGTLRQAPPVIYQMIDGVRQVRSGGYRLVGKQSVAFQVDAYERHQPLVIDPVLIYATYLGGTALDQANGVAVDASGSAYVTGVTASHNFPVTAGDPIGDEDTFITKFTIDGSDLIYSTYIGGTADDEGDAIAVDSAGAAYITGVTISDDFPVAGLSGTTGATGTINRSTSNGGSDAFVLKLNPAGTGMVYSAYLGGDGNDNGAAIAVDSAGAVYVAGGTSSDDFPTVGLPGISGPLDVPNGNPGVLTLFDGFVTKLAFGPTGGTGTQSRLAVVYSTYLGGSGTEKIGGIAVDHSGAAYVTGYTTSDDFPTVALPGVAGPLDRDAVSGGQDAFVTKLTFGPTGGTGTQSRLGIAYSTLLGGGNGVDVAAAIAVDPTGNAYVVGDTSSTNFPTAPTGAGSIGPTGGTGLIHGTTDAFVTKLIFGPTGGTGTLDRLRIGYSTYLGGTGTENGYGIAVDGSGRAWVTGFTTSTNYPTVGPLPGSAPGDGDAFVSELNAAGTALTFSTLVGGSNADVGNAIAVDGSGSAYVVGYTASLDFIGLGSTQGLANQESDDPFQLDHALDQVNFDAFLVRIGPLPPVIAPPVLTIAPHGKQTFTVTGADGAVHWVYATNASGGTLNATTGAYVAGPVGDVTDIVEAVDSVNNFAAVTITVTAALGFSSSITETPPKSSFTFVVTGGATPYTFTLPTNGSGGTITADGHYATGPSGSTTDVVLVTDAVGATLSQSISIGPGVLVGPPTKTLAPGGKQIFTASGGSNHGFTWSFATGGNNSGGTIDASSGAYVAGNLGGVVDTIQATDSLTNVGTAVVTVSAGLAVSPSAPTVPPRATQQFTASGGSGGYTFALTTTTGATLNSAHLYKAGSTPGATDTITVTDSNQNTATAIVTVGPGVSLTVATPVVPPHGTLQLAGAGGSGTGYTFTLVSGASGDSVSNTGLFTAGANAGAMDTVKVTDSLGNTANVTVAVGPGVSITPAAPSLAPLGTISFSALGGSGTGFVWAIKTNGSGGSIIGATGVYIAGAKGSTSDVIQVTDSLNNSATTTVKIGAALAISPTSITVAPKATHSFSAANGNAPYAFSLPVNGSGGTIDMSTGAYKAGPTPNTTDTVLVQDANHAMSMATVTIGAGVSITPTAPTVAPLGKLSFTGAGGSTTGFTWLLSTNGSGGRIDASSGAYVAGSTPSTTDTVTLTDSLGNTAHVDVTVGPGVSITPSSPHTTPLGTVSFSAAGGSGGYMWSVSSSGSGGTIDAASGAYTAGPTGGTTDTVQATDSNGNSSSTNVTVGPGVSITPATSAVSSGASITFSATGGSGTGFVFAFVTNDSSGTLDTASGAYVAGARSGNDVVKVTDSLGSTAQATVTVTALPIDAGKPDAMVVGTMTPDAAGTTGPSGGSGSGGGCEIGAASQSGGWAGGLFLAFAFAGVTIRRRKRG